MKNLFKKIGALLMAAVMVLSMCTAVFADGQEPTAADRATITVNNVEAGLTVTAYQITKAKYQAGKGFRGYEKVNSSYDIADVLAPTAYEVAALAKVVAGNGGGVTLTGNGTTYTADVAAGYWIVLVTAGANNTKPAKVYNPMLAGVYYSVSGTDNTMTSNPIDASQKWSLNGTEGYAKSNEVTVDKTIVNSGSGNNKGDDVAIDDEVNYKITSTIPEYSAEYNNDSSNVTYTINDTLNGLAVKNGSVVVKVGDDVIQAGDDTFALQAEGQTVKVAFAKTFILNNGGKNVEVTYTATLTDDTKVNFDAHTNTVYVEYSNDPSSNSTARTDEKKTYHYTFAIDGNINGTKTEHNRKTTELVKVDENGKVISTKSKEEIDSNTQTSVATGATFTLTSTTDSNKVYTATTDEDGHMTFKGLDAGTYKLVETVAPEGFTLDTQEHTVVISATYNDDGTLKSYTIAIDENPGSTYTATYNNGTITKIDGTSSTTEIVNTKMGTLPSTGGMGTYLFTIIGVVVMAVAAGAFFISRRRTSEE